MVIKASVAHHINALLDELKSGDHTGREVATARLIVAGAPAVERLTVVASDARESPAVRMAALEALEAIGDPRALGPATHLTADADDGVAAAAVAIVRTFISGPHGLGALDALTALVLDAGRSDGPRMRALDAMAGLGPDTLQPVLRALYDDPSPRLRAAARAAAGEDLPATAPADWLVEGPREAVPDDPGEVRRQVLTRGRRASLAGLQQLVAWIREREATAPETERTAWMMARSAAHVVLARRGSRLALYDLRETLDTTRGPLPVELLSVLILIGDRSCLEPVVAAYARALAQGDRKQAEAEWWARHLADAFHAIVARERLTLRHALLRRARARWPDALQSLWRHRTDRPGSRT